MSQADQQSKQTIAHGLGMGFLGVCVQLVDFSYEMEEMAEAHHEGGLWRFFKPVPSDRWLRLYRRRLELMAGLAACLSLPEQRDRVRKIAVKFVRAERALSRCPKAKAGWLLLANGQDIPEELRRHPILLRYSRLMKCIGYWKCIDDLDESARLCTELRFLMCVEFMCWIHAGRSSGRLLQEARHGDLDALDLLLRIDKTAILDPGVQRIFERAAQTRDLLTLSRIGDALKKAPRKISRKHAKEKVAGFLGKVLGPAGVSTPKIREMLDGVAKYRSGGREQVDTDLPTGEPFRKVVTRHRKDWEGLWPPGQK